jgi:molybdopterin adenylyltransferase
MMVESGLSKTVAEHRKKAGAARAGVAVITLSTTRTAGEDKSGDLIQELLEDGGHRVVVRKIITDSRNVLRATLRELVRLNEIQAIVTTGGTGLAASDITIETVRGMLEKELTGFNALFMMLSFPQAKSASMLSRATAGVIKGKLIFCLPGSPNACRLAIESLILPELGHMLHLLDK